MQWEGEQESSLLETNSERFSSSWKKKKTSHNTRTWAVTVCSKMQRKTFGLRRVFGQNVFINKAQQILRHPIPIIESHHCEYIIDSVAALPLMGRNSLVEEKKTASLTMKVYSILTADGKLEFNKRECTSKKRTHRRDTGRGFVISIITGMIMRWHGLLLRLDTNTNFAIDEWRGLSSVTPRTMYKLTRKQRWSGFLQSFKVIMLGRPLVRVSTTFHRRTFWSSKGNGGWNSRLPPSTACDNKPMVAWNLCSQCNSIWCTE